MLKLMLICMHMWFFINVQAQEVLRLNDPFNSPESEFLTAVWKVVAKRNNVQLIIQKMPTKRSIMNANSGFDDADVARVFNISKFYPNMLPVPESIYQTHIIALTKRADLDIKQLQDLKPYHIGVIRGQKMAELNIVSIQPRSIIKVTTHEKLLKLLDENRIDVAFAHKMGIFNEVLQSKTDEHYYMYAGALIGIDLYMQLNKKFKQYVSPFARTLQNMKKNGVYQELKKKYLNLDVSTKVKQL